MISVQVPTVLHYLYTFCSKGARVVTLDGSRYGNPINLSFGGLTLVHSNSGALPNKSIS